MYFAIVCQDMLHNEINNATSRIYRLLLCC